MGLLLSKMGVHFAIVALTSWDSPGSCRRLRVGELSDGQARLVAAYGENELEMRKCGKCGTVTYFLIAYDM